MLEISCAFATSLDTPEHVRIAEELGYRRAWLYDSPALYPDVWMTLALAAQRTSRIGLGPAVLVPSLRHPMANAAAIAQLAHLAPGRVEVAVGSGFTGRMTFGQRPLSWRFVRQYIETLKALLRGEKAEWEGRMIQMMQPDGFAPGRPIEVPIVVGAGGPKGVRVAEDLADGVFVTTPPRGPVVEGRDWRCIVLTFGTVLGEGEDPGAERVVDAAGHGAAVGLHAMYERGMDLSRVRGGAEWRARVDAIPENERHLMLHGLHLIGVSEHDRPLITGDFIRQAGMARTADEWRRRLDELEQAGATEIAYQPAGPDIPGELRRFAEVARISLSAAVAGD
ncbi:MAG TPA: LLM class flavin-dependent oxidoreductase [Tepidiformaceae bacterium]|nr:LLM class flavin-dependent oxidoreductase [Tepidiformaceae bacterium]